MCKPLNKLVAMDFEYAFARFPNLTSSGEEIFRQHYAYQLRGCIHDQCIVNLSRHCPLITSLKLQHGIVTDAGVTALLEGYRGRPLKVLSFAECWQLSDTTLLKIAELFPSSLDYLSLEGTRVTKSAMLVLLQSAN